MRKRLLGIAAVALAALISGRLGLIHEPFFIYCPPAEAIDAGTSLQAAGTASTGNAPVVDLPLPLLNPNEADAALTPGKPASDPQRLHHFLMKAFAD